MEYIPEHDYGWVCKHPYTIIIGLYYIDSLVFICTIAFHAWLHSSEYG